MSNTAEDLIYQTKNLLLTYPADWYIQKDTFDAVKDSIAPIVSFYEDSGVEPRKDTKLDKIIEEPLKDVYTVPFFSEKFCDILLDEMKNFKNFVLKVQRPVKSPYLDLPHLHPSTG